MVDILFGYSPDSYYSPACEEFSSQDYPGTYIEVCKTQKKLFSLLLGNEHDLIGDQIWSTVPPAHDLFNILLLDIGLFSQPNSGYSQDVRKEQFESAIIKFLKEYRWNDPRMSDIAVIADPELSPKIEDTCLREWIMLINSPESGVDLELQLNKQMSDTGVRFYDLFY